jgi:hypothetical protein
MALAFQLQAAGYTPTELSTEAAVSLESEGRASAFSSLVRRDLGNLWSLSRDGD